jgi:hypothetical protein
MKTTISILLVAFGFSIVSAQEAKTTEAKTG